MLLFEFVHILLRKNVPTKIYLISKINFLPHVIRTNYNGQG